MIQELFLDVECLGNILNIVSCISSVIPVEKGDYISALCWTEIIENEPYEEKNTEKLDLELLLGCLTDMEEILIRKRYGIGSEMRMGIKEIADELCISLEQAEKIERNALLKLNSPGKQEVFERCIHQ